MKKRQRQVISLILLPFVILALTPSSALAMATNRTAPDSVGYSSNALSQDTPPGSSRLEQQQQPSANESTPVDTDTNLFGNTDVSATYDKIDGEVFSQLLGQITPHFLLSEAASSDTNPYTYIHDTQTPYWHRSPHRYAYTYGSGYTPAMYHLKHSTGEFPTYCCDLLTSIEPGAKYRRLNLEDAQYYSPTKAPHIRGILARGYWPGRNNLKDLENASGAKNLTGAEALSATQCAIWHFANTDELTDIYMGTRNINTTSDIKDITAVNPKEGNKSVLTYMKKSDENINAVYQYLLTQKDTAPASVIWSFEQESTILTIHDSLDHYDITVLFRMKGSYEGINTLTLTASLEQTGTTIDSKSYNLYAKELTQDANGYYSITFTDIDAELLLDETWVKLSLDGTQMVKEDVYFYEPYGGYEAAQCFVGYGSGSTPLHSEKTIPIQKGERNLTLYKYDASAGRNDIPPLDSGSILINDMVYPPIKGIPFNLYVKIDDHEPFLYPYLARQVTDANGVITWQGLIDSENIQYYCKEAGTKLGYQQMDDQLIPFVDNTAYVGNRRDVGELKIYKEITGNPADPTRHFWFEVLLDLTTAELYQEPEKGLAPLSLYRTFSAQYMDACSQQTLHPSVIEFTEVSGKYTATVTLGHGESVLIAGIPIGTSYTVTELADNGSKVVEQQLTMFAQELYVVPKASRSGRIQLGENPLRFENISYRTGQLILSGKKYLDGALSKDSFTFNLYQLSEAGAPQLLETVNNNTEGLFTFSPLTYTQPGTYTYEITESTGKSGYRYDTNRYTVVVTVTQDAQSKALTVGTPAITRSGSQTEVSEILFHNQIERSNSHTEPLILSGKKYLDGRLSKHIFTFNLYQLSAAGAPQLLESVNNNTQGLFTFSPLTYTQPGTYTYEITESTGKSGYRYDTNRYTVVVTVTQDAQSKALTVGTPVITRSGSTTGVSEIVFYNQIPRSTSSSNSYPVPTPPADNTPKSSGPLDSVPDTRDNSLLLWWISLSLLSGCGLLGAYGVWSKKQKTVYDQT